MGLDRKTVLSILLAGSLIAVVIGSPAFGQLIAGTSLNPIGFSNDAHEIDVTTGAATPIFSQAVWGATYDVANDRVLFTSDVPPAARPQADPVNTEDEVSVEGVVGGAHLYEYIPASGTTSYIGDIMDAAGAPFRIDGLAISNGTLYGARAAAVADGIYSIDMGTLQATLVLALTDSISGIDADPDTGIIYGVNDTSLNLVEIDVVGGTVTNVAPYPDPAETDLDGLAVGGGKAYLIPDDDVPGLIYVYDIASGTFDAPLPAPWGPLADIFSGGALLAPPPEPEIPVVDIPTLGGPGLALLVGLLAAASLILIWRRRAVTS